MENRKAMAFLAEELLLQKSGDSADRIGATLYRSRINLTPHQIRAALFAFHSPVSKGVMLCDEVGLGKTIEAGIIMAQYWLEQKRNILVISPAPLVRQWMSELEDKFSLPCTILDTKSYNELTKKGYTNPFNDTKSVKIVTINFASKMHSEIKASDIDLVVIDEAHKLRNVHNPSNVIANNILDGISGFKKVLLTATPLQNNLMELYGLSMLIDDGIFGDKDYFKYRYIKNYEENKQELSERLNLYIERTLRKQVEKYVKYSKRITHTFSYTPTDEEQELYDKITELIHSNPSLGTGRSQTALTSLILRKLLSSSTAAVLGTLKTIRDRISNTLNTGNSADYEDLIESLDEDSEFDDEDEDETYLSETIDNEKLLRELKVIDECISIAETIKVDNKSLKLLEALNYLFSQTDENRKKKILIFTESRRTQDYLAGFLRDHGINKIVLFNGSNDSPEAKEIYDKWLNENSESAKQNSKSTNIRSALLEYFKNDAEVMIATEAGAEGLNIQFCSMVVNYDLPWNPQRIEQRIGRCHRFGQKNDVIVINFLNENNQIDNRVYELLSNKFLLFDDVFGSSDEVLGSLDDDNNFERKIFEIYRQCRTPEEINKAFDDLQETYKADISNEMKKTKELLLENFDQDLQKVFDGIMDAAESYIRAYEYNFLRLCQYALNDAASFKGFSFYLSDNNLGIPQGKYIISSNEREEINIFDNDINGTKIIDYCRNVDGYNMGSEFDLTGYRYKIGELEKYIGKKGVIIVGKSSVESFENSEELIVSARLEDGTYLNPETTRKLFRLRSSEVDLGRCDDNIYNMLHSDFEAASNAFINATAEKNNKLLAEETAKVNQWANDKISGIQLEVEQLRERRKTLQHELDYSTDSQQKLEITDEISKISKKIKSLWLELADNEDQIEDMRMRIIGKLKKESLKNTNSGELFTLEFTIR